MIPESMRTKNRLFDFHEGMVSVHYELAEPALESDERVFIDEDGYEVRESLLELAEDSQ